MPLYNTASTAAALGVSGKWLDNLLSHNKISGVQQARQGIPRRVSIEAIVTIATAKTLIDTIGIPVPAALALAERLAAEPTGTVRLNDAISITFDAEAMKGILLDHLAHAVEVVPRPARGRPRST